MLTDLFILSKTSSISGLDKPTPYHDRKNVFEEMRRQYEAELDRQKSFGANIDEEKTSITRDYAVITTESDVISWVITSSVFTIPLAEYDMKTAKEADSGFDFLKGHAGHTLGVSVYIDKVACVECLDCKRTIYSVKRQEVAS